MASLGVTGLPVAEGGNVHLNVPPVPGQVAPAVPAWANNGGAPVLIIVNKYLQERASLVSGLASWIGETCLPPSPKGPPKILGPPLPARSRSPRVRQAPGASPPYRFQGFRVSPEALKSMLLIIYLAAKCTRSEPVPAKHVPKVVPPPPKKWPEASPEDGSRTRSPLPRQSDNLEFSGKASNRQANIDILQL